MTPEELAATRSLVDHGRGDGYDIARQLFDHIEYMEGLLNTPEVDDFLDGVRIEAAHQEKRWGSEHDEAKTPGDWFWLIGYLAGKALRAALDGDNEKHMHHCISTGAGLANWHRHAVGKGRMCPGYLPASQTGHNPSSLNEG